MDESGFRALILLIPEKYDWVRKLTPIHRHPLSLILAKLKFSYSAISDVALETDDRNVARSVQEG